MTLLTQPPKVTDDFAQLGARLVRFGRALQEPSTTVEVLTRLAAECGITLKLRVAADQEGQPNV